MKVAVITRHAVSNYGSLLQTIATQQVIENMGYTCSIINYIRNDEAYLKHEITLLKRKPSWNNNLLKKIIYLVLRMPESVLAGRKFEKAQLKHLKLTKRYTEQEQLSQDKPIADVYMTGSDQVWGPTEDGSYDSSYCLSFTDASDKRIAYAASFGHNEMSQDLVDYYKNWLSRYNHITVREDNAVSILSEMKLDALQVLDPTFLLDREYWENYITPIPEEKYILVYQIHNDKKLGEYARNVAKEKGRKLIRISASLHQIKRPGKLIWIPNLGKFLSYIRNAECLITDSFHGTAFSIIFNTPFVEVLPNNKTGSRNLSILNLTGLSHRILSNINNIELAYRTVDFTEANAVLKKKKVESIEILRRMIEA